MLYNQISNADLTEVQCGDFIIMYDNNRKKLPLIRYCLYTTHNTACLLVLSFESRLIRENFTEFGSYYTAPDVLSIVYEKFSII